MKKALLLMVILGLVVGCAHLEKEAIQKGYVRENPEYSYTLEVVGMVGAAATTAVTGFGPTTYYSEQRLIWNRDLIMKNYPDCYQLDERNLYCGWQIPFNCVKEKVETEGRWR